MFGRGKGGFLCGVKSSLAHLVEVVHEGLYLTMELSSFGDKIKVIPVYLSGGSSEDWERDFLVLKHYVANLNSDRLVIVGDCNARVGTEQVLASDAEFDLGECELLRNSRDSLLNSKGRRLLEFFDNNGLVIVNGRVPGDTEGHLTFMCGRGTSVIDYCSVSLGILPCISEFSVVPYHYSDHMPIVFKISTGSPILERSGGALPILPKLKWDTTRAAAYSRVLDGLCKEEVGMASRTDIQLESERLVELISLAAKRCGMGHKSIDSEHKGQPWFNKKCRMARKRVFALLRLIRDTMGSALLRETYIECLAEYKLLCISSSRKYWIGLANEFKGVSNARDFWLLAKRFVRQLGVSNVTNICMSDWVRYFEGLLNPSVAWTPVSFVEPLNTSSLQDSPFTLSELKSVVSRLKDGKAPGLDRVGYEFYKCSGDEYLSRLLLLYNKLFDLGEVPETYCRALIYPLFKRKGDRNDTAAYRGLSFIDANMKIFTSLVFGRLDAYVELNDILAENQAGFGKNYSTVDCIFSLMNMISLKWYGGSKLYAFYVDFRAAFDTISRNALYIKLANVGVSTKIINVVRALYKDPKSAVFVNGSVSEFFEVRCGLKQGCAGSPRLFSLYVNDLVQELEGGVRLGTACIKILMFADDFVLVAETVVGLQRNINILENYCETWGLQVNMSKSKIMVFRRGGRLAARESWTFKGQGIEVVNTYTYLGVVMTPGLSLVPHIRERVTAAKHGLNSVWKAFMDNVYIPLNSRLQIFQSVTRAVATYGAQVWGWQRIDSLEKLLRFFIKRLFWLPEQTPNYALYLETGLSSLYLFTLSMHLNYVRKVLNMPANRFPKVTALEVIRRKLSWHKCWKSLEAKYGHNLLDSEGKVSRAGIEAILEAIVQEEKNGWLQCAQAANLHTWYTLLNHEVKCATVMGDGNEVPLMTIRWIFKLRVEGLNLNYCPGRVSHDERCSLCNLNEREDIYHFVGVCPVLKEFRVVIFGTSVIDRNRFVELLDSREYWEPLCRYLTAAWRYRKFMVEQFNF
uniref:Retrovirus-related Pol polyprotein LINE-1 n=3 Tax=Lygus hesperus TaxID=30085 RepID=A0A146M389_LYGHE